MRETFESEKGRKVVSSNFKERFNWDKAGKKTNKNQNAFCLPLIGFFSHIVHNIRFEKQIHNSKRDKRPENLDKTALQSQCFMSLKAVFNSQKIFVVGQINTVLEKLKTSTNVL